MGRWKMESEIAMLPDYVKERTFLIATSRGSRTIQARLPACAVQDWARNTYIRAGQELVQVDENYWFCALIDGDEEFDVWAIALEPEKKKPPAEKTNGPIR